MLPKKLKLKLRDETDFFKKAKRGFSKSFTVFYQKSLAGPRVAVVVPKKVSAKAVERNRIKRLMSAVASGVVATSPDVPYSMVLVAKATAGKMDDSELFEEMKQMIEKIIEEHEKK